jgi:hypothetical protein
MASNKDILTRIEFRVQDLETEFDRFEAVIDRFEDRIERLEIRMRERRQSRSDDHER